MITWKRIASTYPNSTDKEKPSLLVHSPGSAKPLEVFNPDEKPTYQITRTERTRRNRHLFGDMGPGRRPGRH